MYKVGITGGIGSGKTTVCQVFELLGIPVFYADAEAKKVMQTDRILIEGIKNAFGSETYINGFLNRKFLASKVFGNQIELEKLNSLVHPAVFRAFDNWTETQKAPYVIKEAALLFESKSYLDCNCTVLVTSPVELRIERVMLRDNTTGQEVRDRMSKQLSDAEKEKLADFCLANDEKQFLIPQILKLHEHFLNESKAK